MEKKIFAILVSLSLVSIFCCRVATANPDDIDADVSPDGWSIGSKAVGSYVRSNYTFYQNGTVTINVAIGLNATNYTFVNYTAWVLNGHDRYCANFTNDTWATEYMIEPGYPPTAVLNASIGADKNFTFGIRIWLPKTVSHLNLMETFKVVLTSEII